MKPRSLYRIEYKSISGKWVGMYPFQYMQKSFAEGAFQMLKSFYGGNKEYRLIKDKDEVVDTWNTGEVGVN